MAKIDVLVYAVKDEVAATSSDDSAQSATGSVSAALYNLDDAQTISIEKKSSTGSSRIYTTTFKEFFDWLTVVHSGSATVVAIPEGSVEPKKAKKKKAKK